MADVSAQRPSSEPDFACIITFLYLCLTRKQEEIDDLKHLTDTATPGRHPLHILWLSEKPGFRKVSLKSITITYWWLPMFFLTGRDLHYAFSTAQSSQKLC